MAKYNPTLVPISDLPNTQRWLREEIEHIRASTDDIYWLADFVVNYYQVAGYGGIGLNAITALANIGPAWQILPFDVELIAEPRGVTYDLPNNSISFNSQGIWRMNAKVSLEFLEMNQGRRMQLSLYDANLGVPVGPLFNFSVGRNTDGVNLNFNVMFDVGSPAEGIPLQLAVNSAADTFTGVSAIGSIWDANHVSEFKGDVFDGDLSAVNQVIDLGNLRGH